MMLGLALMAWGTCWEAEEADNRKRGVCGWGDSHRREGRRDSQEESAVVPHPPSTPLLDL